MRKVFIAGNWKMNLTIAEARELARKVVELCGKQNEIEVTLAPATTALGAVVEICRQSKILVAGQNCHWEKQGAFTGEVSAEMLRELGCSQVIVGHSERRQYFSETDDSVNKKVHAALRAGLDPIVCVGETLPLREQGKTIEVVERQLSAALQGVPGGKMLAVTVAYEPVWAIGTGRTATPEQAQQVHGPLRQLLKKLYGSDVSDRVRIQYGGSVNPSNIKDLLAQPDVDGALVGGASLKADSFSALVVAGLNK